MGAIAGICWSQSPLMDGKNTVSTMLELVKHRGSHIKLHLASEMCVFGVRHNGTGQKTGEIFFADSKRCSAALDGEIFHLDESSGTFGSTDDYDIILRAYRDYGNDFVNKIDGSYAVALYDGASKKLLLVRDRLGSRPLFYAALKNAIVFASEIKSILATNLFRETVDLRALDNFLSFGYIPNPGTMFESIQQVKPGHILIFEDGAIEERTYWCFRYNQAKKPMEDADYVSRFQEVLKTAVSRRMRKHPNAGVFLSGGLDTSGVAAVMHQLNQGSFKAFTAGFREGKYNEIEDAKIVAVHLGLEHHTVLVQFDRNFPELLDTIVWLHDAPFADTSAIPSYYAAKLARDHLNVVLTGDFPDQLIGGSGHHAEALARARNDPVWRKMLRHKRLNKLVGQLSWRAGGVGFFDKAKRFMYRETFPLEEQRILVNMPAPPLFKRCLYSPELMHVNARNDPLNVARALYLEVRDHGLLDKLLYFDILSYAPDDLMVKVDRMTEAHGLTAISPFHDRELVEFLSTVPSHLKIRNNERKYIMRQALRPMLPKHTLGKKKQGFAAPIGEWLVRKLADYVRDILLDSRTLNRGYFDKKFMRKMVNSYLAGKTDYASGNEATVISLITLELWHRTFIDN